MCWCAVKKLLTHSLVNAYEVKAGMLYLQCINCVIHTWALQSHNLALYKSSTFTFSFFVWQQKRVAMYMYTHVQSASLADVSATDQLEILANQSEWDASSNRLRLKDKMLDAQHDETCHSHTASGTSASAQPPTSPVGDHSASTETKHPNITLTFQLVLSDFICVNLFTNVLISNQVRWVVLGCKIVAQTRICVHSNLYIFFQKIGKHEK